MSTVKYTVEKVVWTGASTSTANSFPIREFPTETIATARFYFGMLNSTGDLTGSVVIDYSEDGVTWTGEQALHSRTSDGDSADDAFAALPGTQKRLGRFVFKAVNTAQTEHEFALLQFHVEHRRT